MVLIVSLVTAGMFLLGVAYIVYRYQVYAAAETVETFDQYRSSDLVGDIEAYLRREGY